MAYWIDPTDHDQNGGTRAFLADSESDLSGLPTSISRGTGGLTDTDNDIVYVGSSCFCIEEQTVHFLKSDNTWK